MSVELFVFLFVLVPAALGLVLWLINRSLVPVDQPPKFRLIQSTAPPDDERLWKWDVLTEREVEIVEKVIDGKRSAEIAKELFLGKGTVDNYLQSIYKKLHVHSRVELIRAVRDHIR